jgi:YesN/AraC family two-component response regulator
LNIHGLNGLRKWNANKPIKKRLKITTEIDDSKAVDRLLKIQEKQNRIIVEREQKHKQIENERFEYMKLIVDQYLECLSLRSVADKFNISHIAVRSWIKKYEEANNVIILKSHGKR